MYPSENSNLETLEPFPVRDAALVAITLVFAVASLVYLALIPSHSVLRPLVIIGVPIIMVVGSLITKYPPLVYATTVLCLLVGVIGMFSIGIPIFVMGICLIAWHFLRSGRRERSKFTWEGLLIVNLFIFPVLFIVAILVS